MTNRIIMMMIFETGREQEQKRRQRRPLDYLLIIWKAIGWPRSTMITQQRAHQKRIDTVSSIFYIYILVFLVCINLAVSMPISSTRQQLHSSMLPSSFRIGLRNSQFKSQSELEEDDLKDQQQQQSLANLYSNAELMRFVKSLIHSFDQDSDENLSAGELKNALGNRTLMKKFEKIVKFSQVESGASTISSITSSSTTSSSSTQSSTTESSTFISSSVASTSIDAASLSSTTSADASSHSSTTSTLPTEMTSVVTSSTTTTSTPSLFSSTTDRPVVNSVDNRVNSRRSDDNLRSNKKKKMLEEFKLKEAAVKL